MLRIAQRPGGTEHRVEGCLLYQVRDEQRFDRQYRGHDGQSPWQSAHAHTRQVRRGGIRQRGTHSFELSRMPPRAGGFAAEGDVGRSATRRRSTKLNSKLNSELISLQV
jgi:hypothetical protein